MFKSNGYTFRLLLFSVITTCFRLNYSSADIIPLDIVDGTDTFMTMTGIRLYGNTNYGTQEYMAIKRVLQTGRLQKKAYLRYDHGTIEFIADSPWNLIRNMYPVFSTFNLYGMLPARVTFSEHTAVITDVITFSNPELIIPPQSNTDNFSSLTVSRRNRTMNSDSFTFKEDETHGLSFLDTIDVPTPGAFLLGCVGLGFSGWKLRKRKES